MSVWYLLQKKPKYITKLVVLLLSFFIAFCTVSNGGLIVMLTMLGILVLKWLEVLGVNRGTIKRDTAIFFALFIMTFIVVWCTTSIGSVIYDKYIVNYLGRLESYSGSLSGATGGRLSDLITGLTTISPLALFIGTGQEGIVTEIGHIYWIGMYGVPAYLIFMWLMFKKNVNRNISDYVWIIPFFVAFTMNIAVGEFKWMAIYLMLLAYYRNSGNGFHNLIYE